jgi:hypothetical protein
VLNFVHAPLARHRQFAVPRRAKPYAIERYAVDDSKFIQIEFYKDCEQHRVWPYISAIHRWSDTGGPISFALGYGTL